VRSMMIVFIGSGLGGVLRHLVGLAALRLLGPNFPYGTLAINVFGSALMGLVVGIFAARASTSLELRLLLTTGLIGGFTTWSTFSLDAVSLWQRREAGAAAAYVAASFLLSVAALLGALALARHWA
jgi:CrcB protein